MAKEIVQEDSLFEGINLSNKREENETYEDYRARLKENASILKLYKQMGRKQMKVIFPNGLKEALNAIKSQGDKVEVQKEENKFQDF